MSAIAAYDYCIRESFANERSKWLKLQADFAAGLSVIHLDIKSLVGSSSQGNFSGSLDAREIRKIFACIGLDLAELKCDEMVQIKVCRNKLAHGECSFQDYGRNLTIQYIGASKDHTFTYLDELICKVDDYMSLKRYRRSVPVQNRNSLLRLLSRCFRIFAQ